MFSEKLNIYAGLICLLLRMHTVILAAKRKLLCNFISCIRVILNSTVYFPCMSFTVHHLHAVIIVQGTVLRYISFWHYKEFKKTIASIFCKIGISIKMPCPKPNNHTSDKLPESNDLFPFLEICQPLQLQIRY